MRGARAPKRGAAAAVSAGEQGFRFGRAQQRDGAEMASEDDDGRVQIGPYESTPFHFAGMGFVSIRIGTAFRTSQKKAQPSEMKCAKKTLRN
jgi:hypothetical protein